VLLAWVLIGLSVDLRRAVSEEPVSTKAVDFGDPPAAEVALTVQFARPIADTAVLAAFVTRLAPEFPNQTLQPALARASDPELRDAIRPDVCAAENLAFGRWRVPRADPARPTCLQLETGSPNAGRRVSGDQAIREELMRHFAAHLEIASVAHPANFRALICAKSSMSTPSPFRGTSLVPSTQISRRS
jgi:hypothetical protein